MNVIFTPKSGNAKTGPIPVSILPIRLAPTPARCRVRPFARIEFGKRRRLRTASNAEQRAEGIERVEATVKAEGELVEIGLQMLGTDAMVDAGRLAGD